MSDEIARLAAEYKQKLQQIELNKKVFTTEQDLLSTLGPKRWQELRKLIKDKMEEFNAELGSAALIWDAGSRADQVSMTRKEDGAKLEFGYDEVARSAFFRCPKLAINLALKQVVRGNDVVFVHVNPTTKAELVNEPEDVAYGLIRDFLTH